MTTAKRSPLGYLSDQETKVDLLNNEAISKTIVRLINETVDSAVTIGVHGDWGAGKSSVLEMVEKAFPDDGDVLCLKFSGWQFQGFEDAKIALIEGVVTGLIEKRSLATKAVEEVKRILKSVDWLKVAKKGGGLALTAYTGLPLTGLDDLLGSVVDSVKNAFTDKEAREAAIKQIEDFKKEKSDEAASKSVPTEIKEFREAYKELIKKAGIKRLVVLIDDLDRCLPQTAIETLEAIRLFVLWDRTAFIVGADEGMIEIAVRDHFKNLPEIDVSSNNPHDTGQKYTRSYLEKLLQVPFRIPALGETETGIYVTLLLLGRALGEDSPEFEKLLALGRAALSKPWEGKGIDHDAIKAAVGKRFDEIVHAVTLADRVSPVLAAGTKGNPRQIKRFLNALALRLAVANERGFGNAIEEPRLAKVMLAEMYLHPTVFDHIATTAANSEDGICPEIALIEKIVADGAGSATADGQENGAPENTNPVIDEWKTRPDVMRWAAVKPDLGAVSLKPYLFVIKDRKNYLGSAAPLPPKLAAFLEKLLGGDMAAKSVLADVRNLVLPEVVLLFDALRRKMREVSSFDVRPAAMAGIAVLVEAHSPLQGRYVDILESLPSDRVGLWVASGHSFVTEETPKARIEALREKWKKTTKNPLLKSELEPKKPTRGGRGYGHV
ncbi:P-loop NTPase fold protein [Bradyrhizobium sp. WYCCWR 13022]|uniref:Qat anti-phage system ATPase QatA n=1 Tax=unclassified Bradyrhizobium TaxID=2631580 RepID=UPI00263B4C9B|nr:Qat anti-phage system ATPase QatA [Bradyrhizobium sp. WYCCWR 13022]MDN4982141.1 P-loop NTPase fold protein [Bradyrhizobium sp. WYCCWR 13022]